MNIITNYLLKMNSLKLNLYFFFFNPGDYAGDLTSEAYPDKGSLLISSSLLYFFAPSLLLLYSPFYSLNSNYYYYFLSGLNNDS